MRNGMEKSVNPFLIWNDDSTNVHRFSLDLNQSNSSFFWVMYEDEDSGIYAILKIAQYY